MLQVAAFVADNPGCCKTEAAHGIGQTNHNYGQGWGPVDRALRVGLIEAVRVRVNRYALYPTGYHFQPTSRASVTDRDRRKRYARYPTRDGYRSIGSHPAVSDPEPDGFWHTPAHP
jgi:hypothetical protein